MTGTVVGQRSVNVDALEARGLMVQKSQHLTMITGARDRTDVKEFNDVFEQAVGLLCQYFEIPESSAEDWHLVACVLRKQNEQTFVDAGLLTDDMPPFPAGFQRDRNIWIYVQDGDYYTRHLLLHEATHAFMQEFLQGYGPPWYAEGMAELLGVHRWQDGRLTMNHRIGDRDEVPYWGRVKLIRRQLQSGTRMNLDEVFAIRNDAFLRVDSYAWAWAACQFFDSHPKFQTLFRKLPSLANQSPQDFSRQFREALSENRDLAEREWNWLIDEIQYGYDVPLAALTPVTKSNRQGEQYSMQLDATRGWQTTEIQVQAGERLEFNVSGTYQVKHDGQPWPCQAGGVTLEYYRGRPLGQLVGAVLIVAEQRANFDSGLGPIIDIGSKSEITCGQSGTLLLRINESPADWSDNQGHLIVQVKRFSD